jgi:hypothetical protein
MRISFGYQGVASDDPIVGDGLCPAKGTFGQSEKKRAHEVRS